MILALISLVLLVAAKKNPMSEWGKLETAICGGWNKKIKRGCNSAAK